jgi:hypothetical protein
MTILEAANATIERANLSAEMNAELPDYGFDYLELAAIHYQSLTGHPTNAILAEVERIVHAAEEVCE